MGKTKGGKKKKKVEAPAAEEAAPAAAAPVTAEPDDWATSFEEPTVDWVAPEDQLQLTQEELGMVGEAVLTTANPNNPNNRYKFSFETYSYEQESQLTEDMHVHCDFPGTTLHVEGEVAKSLRQWRESEWDERQEAAKKAAEEAGGEGVEGTTEVSKNQFNYSDRAAQTFNNALKTYSCATKPPVLNVYNAEVSQWKIYDLYVSRFVEDLQDQKLREENAKKKKAGAKGKPVDEEPKPEPKDDDVVHSHDMVKVLKVMERMVNMNAEAEIYEDFKYWEDQSDQFREGEGSLLPLWRFSQDKVKRHMVTAMAWNPNLPDLFAVAYGSYDFMRQRAGVIMCYSLKNTSAPEYQFTTESGIMCLDFHTTHHALLCVGCYDGTVMVFDVRSKNNKPIYQSTIKSGKHTDPVWQTKWQEMDLAKELAFFSVSTDGLVASWTLSKNELSMEKVMELKLVIAEKDEPDEETSLVGLAGGCCFDFNTMSEHLFLVGTEEGKIHKCSKAYSGQYLQTYEGHHMAVYSVKWNPFHPRIFLSCSADWTVKLWDHNVKFPIMSFDLGNAVGDVTWAPYSSTVFAAVTSDGKVSVYDLAVNKHEPLCEQKVVKRAKLTHVCFNQKHPIILVGDDHGGVNSLKLSPNLRLAPEGIDLREKMDKLLATVDYPTVS